MQMNFTPTPAHSRIFSALALALLAPVFLFADALKWENTFLHFETDFGDEVVTAQYPFTNTSDESITIAETKASCGCTVPTLEKYDYAPGESGVLTAVFTLGSRQGEQHKVISVHTESEGGDSAFYELKLEVDIPVPVSLKPRVRFWNVSDQIETQTIEVTFHEKMATKVTGLVRKDDTSPADFDVEIETVEPNHKYLINLTPKDPSKKTRDVFVLQGEGDSQDTLSKFPIYAYIR